MRIKPSETSGMRPQRSVTERNIDSFHSHLLFEEDPGTRDALLTLLIEEENRYGRKEEQIFLLKKKIAFGEVVIQKQLIILEEMIKNNEDSTLAKKALINFTETQRLLQNRLNILERQP